MKLYNGYKRLNRNYTLLTDEYEFSMSNAYFINHKEKEEAVFDIFFRKVPNDGGYAIMAGLDKIIPYIEDLKFNEENLEYLRKNGYDEEFIEYLKNFKFTGNIYAVPDGTPVFPNEPIVTIKAPIIEAQIIETAILSIINGAMEHATAARKIVEATPKNVPIMEFGARRADGLEAAIDASIYAIMAGCAGTSNALAADMLGIKGLGTQAHSYIESFASEYDAFLAYAKAYPNNCLLLVDTIDTLKSGVVNAIKVAKEYLIPNGYRLKGIRIDSGDLAYLSKEARKMLDEAGLEDATICLSNGLNAKTIKSLQDEGAYFDSLGVGDNISKPNGRMGCVYKEVALINSGETIIREKLLKNGMEKEAVVILAITDKNEVLLSVEPRVFTKETVLANLPAGYREKNETIYEAALRELKEETGYVTNDIELINSYYQDQGISGALNYSFICRNCIKETKQNLDKDEYINIFKCNYNDIEELIKLGFIKDANSILTILSSKEREMTKHV